MSLDEVEPHKARKLVSMPKSINIYWPWEIEVEANIEGTAIIIDVFAASSNIANMLNRDVKELLIVNEENIEKASSLYPQALRIGESQKLGEEFFHVSNSPTNLWNYNLTGKIVLFMTNNGSRVVELAFAKGIIDVILCSFTNLRKTVSKLVKTNRITIIPAGERSMPGRIPDGKCLEDLLCARALKESLLGKLVDWNEIFRQGKLFIKTHYPPNKNLDSDIKRVFQLDIYPIVPICHKEEDGFIHLKKA